MGKEVYGIVEELVCMCKCAQKNITKNNNIENVKYIVNKSDSILDDFGHISLHRGCWCRCCAFLISNFSLNAHLSGRRYGGVRVFIRYHYLLFLYPILVWIFFCIANVMAFFSFFSLFFLFSFHRYIYIFVSCLKK